MASSPDADRTLRVLTYLSPSIPLSLFTGLAAHIGTALGREVVLSADETRSGPRPSEPEPFSTGEVDVAFLCATSYVWLTAAQDPPIRLVGAAWVPTDPRAGGNPVYFGDVLAPAGGAARLGDLAGRRVAYNDDVSLSGYHSLRLALSQHGTDPDAVRYVRSGSHLRSLDLLVTGEVDAAAIDSTVWRRLSRQRPELAGRLRPVAALGPHPVQPVVARADLPDTLRRAIRDALLTAHQTPVAARALGDAELRRFVRVDDAHYRPLAASMAALDHDLPTWPGAQPRWRAGAGPRPGARRVSRRSRRPPGGHPAPR